MPENPINLVALIRHCGFAPSNGEARRLIEQGAAKLNGEKLTDPAVEITVSAGDEFQVGKKNFARLSLPGA